MKESDIMGVLEETASKRKAAVSAPSTYQPHSRHCARPATVGMRFTDQRSSRYGCLKKSNSQSMRAIGCCAASRFSPMRCA